MDGISPRRTYYDHEPVYQKIAARNGRGWDDLSPGKNQGSYDALLWFLDSLSFPARTTGLKALDLGCGGGQAAFLLAARGVHVVGIDYSKTAVTLANRNAAECGLSVEFRVGDCLDLAGIPDSDFDLVIDNHVLHCLVRKEDRFAFLSSAFRVLKSGGVFFSETMSAEGPLDFEALNIDPATRVARNGVRYWVKQDELVNEIRTTGFHMEHQQRRQQRDQPPCGDTIVTVARRCVPSQDRHRSQ